MHQRMTYYEKETCTRGLRKPYMRVGTKVVISVYFSKMVAISD